MQSFYGGKQGASFEIKKRFDGIDISPNTIYKKKYFARVPAQGSEELKIGEGVLLLDDYNNLIERNANNINLFTWGIYETNGLSYNAKSGDNNIQKVIPVEYAEGMNQFFAKGAETLNEVNYGEYVIIDTIYSGVNIDSIDNGKIYRRGFNNNAEYVCQISAIAYTPKREMEWSEILSKPDNLVQDSDYLTKVEKLNGIEEGAQVHIQSNWTATDTSGILNKPTSLSSFNNDIVSIENDIVYINGEARYELYSKTAVDDLLDTKYTIEEGLGLTHNDFTDELKEKASSATKINDEDINANDTLSSSKIYSVFTRVQLITQNEYDQLEINDQIDSSIYYLIYEPIEEIDENEIENE